MSFLGLHLQLLYMDKSLKTLHSVDPNLPLLLHPQLLLLPTLQSSHSHQLDCICGGGNGTPLQDSCLGNPMDGRTWWAAVHWVSRSWTRLKRLHFHFSLSCIGEGNGNPLQCSCLENPRDARASWAAIYGVAQSWTWLKRLSMHTCIGEGMATHSSILAWRIPGTEEPGGLPSMGSHRVRHD